MALVALLFAHHGAGSGGEPPAALPVAGMTVVERQVATVRASGAARVLVVVERMPPGLAAALDRADVEIVRAATGLRIAPDDRVLVLADALLVDPRIVAGVLARNAAALAVWRGRGAHDGAERLDPGTHWAGVALYGGEALAATLAGLGEWDLQATLLRTALADGKPTRIDVAAIGCGDAPLLWTPVRTPDEADAAARAELASGRAEGRDWPSRLIFLPIEDMAMPRLLARRVTPLTLLAAATGLAVVGVAAFAAGDPWLGLTSALLSGPPFALARRIVQVRRVSGRGAEALAPIALVSAAGWYVALALWFCRSHEWAGPCALAALILTGGGGTLATREACRRLTGRSLDDSGPFERRLRLIGGSPNALIWSLLPFATLGLWWPGYIVLAAYALCTFVLTGWRLFVCLAASPPIEPPAAAKASPAAPRSARMFEDVGDVGGK